MHKNPSPDIDVLKNWIWINIAIKELKQCHNMLVLVFIPQRLYCLYNKKNIYRRRQSKALFLVI